MVGGDQTFFCMLPAHQGLGADGLPLTIHLNLVMQHKLLLRKTSAQVFFHGVVGRHGGLHGGVKKARCIAPR